MKSSAGVAQSRLSALSGLMSSVDAASLGDASMRDVARRIRLEPDAYRLRFELFALACAIQPCSPARVH